MSNPWTGAVAEFPGVAVDCFTRPAALYLLSHAHSDHLGGIDARHFNGRVHCHHTTKQLLGALTKYRHLGDRIVGHHYNQPFGVSIDGATITVTLIASDHCPGSAMMLIEGAQGAVVVTGDIKAEPWWVESLRRNPLLTPYRLGTRRLLNVYFDSTFMYRGEPYLDLAPNADATDLVVSALKQYPMDDADVAFGLGVSTLGADEVVAAAAASFGGKVYTPHAHHIERTSAIGNDYHSAVAYAPILAQTITPEYTGRGPWFFLGATPPVKFPVAIHLPIHLSADETEGFHRPVPIAELTASELRSELSVVDHTANGHRVCRYKQRLWLWRQGGLELLPQTITACFSRHATYSEIYHLISTLNPIEVFGCATFSPNLLKRSWLAGGSMARLFGPACQGETFHYDTLMFQAFGRPLDHKLTPPTTVDRWGNVTSSKSQLPSEVGASDVRQFAIVGQQARSRRQQFRSVGAHGFNRGHSQFWHHRLHHGLSSDSDGTTTSDSTSDNHTSPGMTFTAPTSPLAKVPHNTTKASPKWRATITATVVDVRRQPRRPYLHRAHATYAAKTHFHIDGAMAYSQHVVCLCHISLPPSDGIGVDDNRVATIAARLRNDPTHWLLIKPQGLCT
ncbi:hypothetical protein DIRU0_E02168 [Diutina rugosa]